MTWRAPRKTKKMLKRFIHWNPPAGTPQHRRLVKFMAFFKRHAADWRRQHPEFP